MHMLLGDMPVSTLLTAAKGHSQVYLYSTQSLTYITIYVHRNISQISMDLRPISIRLYMCRRIYLQGRKNQESKESTTGHVDLPTEPL